MKTLNANNASRSEAPASERPWERCSASQAGVSSDLISAFSFQLSAFPKRFSLLALLISAFSFQLSAFSQPPPIAAGPATPAVPRAEPASPAAAATAPLPRSGNYVLSQNDVIAVHVFREPDLDSQYRISKDGTINFPMLGVVNIAGKTANDAAAYLAALLDKDYIIKPQVSVSVVAYVKQRYSVLGQVGAPGGYNIPEEQTLDLLSAIAAAGGFTRLANQSKVIVKRQENGKPQTYKLDARAYGKDKGAKPFVILPNDTIIVEERFF
jgi:polysaccharide export outer membrane protein